MNEFPIDSEEQELLDDSLSIEFDESLCDDSDDFWPEEDDNND